VSNGHVTDYGTSPKQLKVVTPKSSKPHCSITAQNRRLVTIGHL